MSTTQLSGIIVPTTTPFTDNGDIDFPLVSEQVDWLADAGVHGIAVGGSTGEGHALMGDEYAQLIETAVASVNDRFPVIAGIITDSTRESVRRGQLVRDMGVAALQVTPVHYLFRPDDDATVEHFRILTEETGLPVIIYNVVPWSYLDPDLLCRVMNEVPGVIGVKQSAGDVKLFADLMIKIKPGQQVFSACDALLYPCYSLGAHGAIAAILTAAPKASVELWNAVQAGDHERALDLHERLLVLWNAMIGGEDLPAATKSAQAAQGVASGMPRMPMKMPLPARQAGIRDALKGLT
jgi:4-hydroxy-tetrahydrodipicolinate synthase